MRAFHPVVQAALDAGVSVRVVWRRDEPQVRAQAIDLWRRLRVLPPTADPEERANEIVAAAYVNGALAGVATAYADDVLLLRQRFYMWRCAVAAEARRNHVMRALAGYSREILEDWSREHPGERIMGMASIAENRELAAASLPAILPSAGLMMVGYTPDGSRIRVAWFEHARV